MVVVFAKTILHFPRLDTVWMVEKTIQNSKRELSRMELWKRLPKKVQYQTFQVILDYLLRSNKIVFSKENKIVWIATNPRLEAIVEKSRHY